MREVVIASGKAGWGLDRANLKLLAEAANRRWPPAAREPGEAARDYTCAPDPALLSYFGDGKTVAKRARVVTVHW